MGRTKLVTGPVDVQARLGSDTVAWLREGPDGISASIREVIRHARLIEALRDPEAQERFWERVHKRRCWKYRSLQEDHPILLFEIDEAACAITAHVASWLMAFGTITPGKVVLQTCGQAACVRPGHLYLGEAV